MRPQGTAIELERRRRLAVQRIGDGYSTKQVADFLDADPSSARRWVAAFQLHQAAERFYDAVLPVFTNYRPKSHDQEKPSHMVAGFDPVLLTVFLQATDEQKKCFDLLKRAHVEARCNPGYKIAREQPEYLAERVQRLQDLT